MMARSAGGISVLSPAVAAAAVAAGVIGAAFADLAAVIDGDLPGFLWYLPDGGAFPFAQFPADGVDELVAGHLLCVCNFIGNFGSEFFLPNFVPAVSDIYVGN